VWPRLIWPTLYELKLQLTMSKLAADEHIIYITGTKTTEEIAHRLNSRFKHLETDKTTNYYVSSYMIRFKQKQQLKNNQIHKYLSLVRSN